MDWKEVGIDCETHLRRVIEMYEELGFEVKLEEISPQELEHCIACLEARGEKVYRIYTRRKQGVES